MEIAGLSEKKLTAENIAFGIVPRINAAGRMGSANLAMELLLCEDEEHAAELAGQINTLNQERQQQEATIMADIERILTAHPEKLKKRVLVLAGEGLASRRGRHRVCPGAGTLFQAKHTIVLLGR